MRGLKMLIVCILALLSIGAAAQTCADTDGGGSDDTHTEAITEKGEVTYGITTKEDTCLSSQEGFSVNQSQWLREYYCGGNPEQRKSKVYDCVRLGYSGCEDGACVDTSSSNTSATTTQTTQTYTQTNHCGNDIVEKDKGEECDPPGSICFGRTSAQYGSCQADCTCKIAKAALENSNVPVVCGDGYIDSPEECEEDEDCETGYVCSSCKCVKQLTPEEIEEMKQAAKGDKEEQKAVENETAEAVEEAPEIDVNLTPKNYSNTPAMKATSGIASFFKTIFSWIGSLFN